MIDDFGLAPDPPQWALDAGLPAPREDEGFAQYVTRIGLDAEDLLVDLDTRTACLANLRLATVLQRTLPVFFERHVKEWTARHRMS